MASALGTPIYEKEGVVLLVQTDHLSGEDIGTAIAALYSAGAFNVQVIPTVTKKNRPGHLFVVDCLAAGLPAVEDAILDELESTGWHMVKTGHRHVATEIREFTLEFDTPSGRAEFPVKVKAVKCRPRRWRPEHDSCAALREFMREAGVKISTSEARMLILEKLQEHIQLERSK